ncbi:MAG: HTTM domain-containing protein [Frankia sp.]|nr:HTTM domain-containing protein [Frankia sp.]
MAALRTVLYLFIPVDVLLTTTWVARHADVPASLYQPLFVARVLHLPAPTALSIRLIEVLLLVAAVAAATGRAPRLLGWAVFGLYTTWMFIAMSYGKVDHDRFAFLVALAVMPTVGAARWCDEREDSASGWAISCIQLAVVLTYLLATVAKLRFGDGLNWANGATFTTAVIRRGTFLGHPLLDYPSVLVAAQWGILAFETCSPLMLLRNRLGHAYVVVAVLFHVVTFATITIIFLPHVMCLLAWAPLERVDARRAIATARSRVRGLLPDAAG